jgi:glycosyltransferase involved in cell wall biosynthesis
MNPPRKPRLTHLIDLDGPGGGPRTIIDQIRHMRDRFDLTVVHGGFGALAQACDGRNVQRRQLPIDRAWKLLWGFPLLVLALRRLRPDILIMTGQTAGPVGALAGRLAGVKRMVYIAEWPAFYTNWDIWRMVRNTYCEKIPCYYSDKVITVSEGNYYEYLYRRLAGPDKLTLLSNSVDLATIPGPAAVESLRGRLGWNPDLCHVVSVARLATQKHIEWLLEAWQRVVEERLPARLWLVGSGEEEARLRALAGRLGLGDTCTFLGYQPDGIFFISAADVVAVTTMYEANAITVLEAMACGRPVVSNRVDGVTGSFTHGREGFLAEPADADGLARGLIALIRDPALRVRMGAQGRETARRFDSAVVMPRYEALYEALLAEKASR